MELIPHNQKARPTKRNWAVYLSQRGFSAEQIHEILMDHKKQQPKPDLLDTLEAAINAAK